MRESPATLCRTRMARPFIRICTLIYNGVSPCSTFTHQKLTTSTTNISGTQERPSRASSHLSINLVRHQAQACCTAQAARAAWCRDGPSTLTAPTEAHQGAPKRACVTDTTLIQSPEHGPGVQCKAPGHVAPDVRMRPLPALGAWQGRSRSQ